MPRHGASWNDGVSWNVSWRQAASSTRQAILYAMLAMSVGDAKCCVLLIQDAQIVALAGALLLLRSKSAENEAVMRRSWLSRHARASQLSKFVILACSMSVHRAGAAPRDTNFSDTYRKTAAAECEDAGRCRSIGQNQKTGPENQFMRGEGCRFGGRSPFPS